MPSRMVRCTGPVQESRQLADKREHMNAKSMKKGREAGRFVYIPDGRLEGYLSQAA